MSWDDGDFVLLSLGAAARIAGVSRTTLVRWMGEGFVAFKDTRGPNRQHRKAGDSNPRRPVYRFIVEDLIGLQETTRGDRMEQRRSFRVELGEDGGPAGKIIRHPSNDHGPRREGEKTRIMTHKAAAKYAKVSQSSISRWLSEGVLEEEDARLSEGGYRVFDLDALESIAQASKDGTLRPGRLKRKRLAERFSQFGVPLDEFPQRTQVKKGQYSPDVSRWERVFAAEKEWKNARREFGDDDPTTRFLHKFMLDILAEDDGPDLPFPHEKRNQKNLTKPEKEKTPDFPDRETPGFSEPDQNGAAPPPEGATVTVDRDDFAFLTNGNRSDLSKSIREGRFASDEYEKPGKHCTLSLAALFREFPQAEERMAKWGGAPNPTE